MELLLSRESGEKDFHIRLDTTFLGDEQNRKEYWLAVTGLMDLLITISSRIQQKVKFVMISEPTHEVIEYLFGMAPTNPQIQEIRAELAASGDPYAYFQALWPNPQGITDKIDDLLGQIREKEEYIRKWWSIRGYEDLYLEVWEKE